MNKGLSFSLNAENEKHLNKKRGAKEDNKRQCLLTGSAVRAHLTSVIFRKKKYVVESIQMLSSVFTSFLCFIIEQQIFLLCGSVKRIKQLQRRGEGTTM